MAMTQIRVVIDASDNASKVLQGVGKSISGLGSTVTGVGKSLQAFGASATALGGTLARNITAPMVAAGVAIGALVVRAGKLESVTDAYRTMTESVGISGEELIKKVKKATSGTMSEFDVMTNFLKAKTLIGMEALGEGGENFERFAVIAKKAARTTGQDVDFMFESIVNGIGRTSTKWLDNTGIVVSATQAYKEYAEQIGVTVEEMTEEQKKIALTTTYLEKAEREYANVAVTAGGVSSSIARFRVAMEEARDEIAMSFVPAVQGIIEALTPIVVEWGPKIATAVTNIINKFTSLSPTMQKVILGFVALTATLGPFLMVLGSVSTGVGALITLVGSLTTAVTALFTLLMAHPLVALTVAVAALTTAIGLLILNSDLLKTKTDLVTEAQNRQKESTDKLIDAENKLKNAHEGIIDAELRLEGAQITRDKAQKTLDASVVQYGKDTDVTRDAQHFLNLAERELEKAQTDLNKKVDDGAIAVQEYDKAERDLQNTSAATQKALESEETWWGNVSSKIGDALRNLRDYIREKLGWEGAEGGGFPFRAQTGGTVPGPIGAPVSALVHGGETIRPAGVAVGAGAGGGEINFYVNVGLYAGAETEKRNIARELYAALVQVAQSQNRTVQELMGG